MPTPLQVPRGPYDSHLLNAAWRLGWAKAHSPCPDAADRLPIIDHTLLEPYNVGYAQGLAAKKLADAAQPVAKIP